MCSRKLFYLNYIKLMIKINKINKKIYMINICGRVDTKKKSPDRLCGNKKFFRIECSTHLHNELECFFLTYYTIILIKIGIKKFSILKHAF